MPSLSGAMRIRRLLQQMVLQEDVNFLLTNRIPRRWLTQLVGRISRIRNPWVRDLTIGLWRLFSDLDLSEAKRRQFASLHECFIRELKDGARPVDGDPAILCSPSDGIVGACGQIRGLEVIQAKGFPYTLADLLGEDQITESLRDGCYVTLRLTSTMYHRFHAPHDCRVRQVRYFSGDTWNVNPIALQRVEKLFCKNERALIVAELSATGHTVLMVPVAAILVASIRLTFIDVLLHLRYRGLNPINCDARLVKGEQMGWFEHGSTIIVFAPARFTLADGIGPGGRVRMGQPLMRLPPS